MKKSISTFKRLDELELLHATFTTQFFKPHFHKQYALILVEEGIADYSYKDKRLILEAGSMLLLNPFEVHTGKLLSGETWRFRSLYISQALFHRCYAKCTKALGVPRFAQSILQDQPFVAQFTQMHEYLLGETEETTAQAAIDSLVRMLTKICDFDVKPGKWIPVEEKASRIKAYLDAHYSETIRLDELARKLGMSKYYLIRLFESVYGLSPIGYTINLRIEKAKRLLNSGMKYTEVAYSTGFYDQSHFIRHFKMIVGVTPKAFC